MLTRWGWAVVLLAVWLAGGAAAPPTGAVVGRGDADGRILLGELNCAACHARPDAAGLPPRRAPILAEVGRRVTPQYLRAFVADPHATKPGTPMPDLLHALPAAEKRDAADALTHYLSTLGGPAPAEPTGATEAQIEAGRVLYHTVGCVACHAPFAPPPEPRRAAVAADEGDDDPKPAAPSTPHVPLGDLARKTTVDALAGFLADPLHARPSGRMPRLHLTPTEARQVAAYLLREQHDPKRPAAVPGVEFALYVGSWAKLPDLTKLTPARRGEWASFTVPGPTTPPTGGPKNSSGPVVTAAGELRIDQPGRYTFAFKSDGAAVLKIGGKVAIDAGAKKKTASIQLTAGRHPVEVAYIAAGAFDLLWQPPSAATTTPIPPAALSRPAGAMTPKGAEPFTPDPVRAEKGRQLFASLGCAACHQTGRKPGDDGLTPLKAPTLAKLNPDRSGGCLAPNPVAGRPRFDLSDAQRTALKAAVADRVPAPSGPPAVIAHTMSAMNCYACHPRGDTGGPDKFRSPYFVYDAVAELGDEGRLPPTLTGVGAKLTPQGFEAAMFTEQPAGQKYRRFMVTRMPDFGRANVGHLPGLFAAADAGAVPDHTPRFNGSMVADGRRLAGKTALACVNCHAWGGHRLPGADGLDLAATAGRLRPGWFHAWLRDPGKVRRGTRMPTAWPEGKSFFPDVQVGDVALQIDAVWAFLQAGEKGGTPPGLGDADPGFLVPTDGPVVFRTFLDTVGTHAVLVGFPERLNLAFDANRVRVAALWSGPFVSTRAAWDGKGALYAQIPSTTVIRPPDGPPFAVLKAGSDPWPADVPKGNPGLNRTPPGWWYLGYRLADNDVPTLRYRMNGIEVEETPTVESRRSETILVRRFVLTAKDGVANLYFRPTAGRTVVRDGTAFVTDGNQRWRVAGAVGSPVVRDAAGGQELVFPVRFTQAPNGSGWVAEFTVEVGW